MINFDQEVKNLITQNYFEEAMAAIRNELRLIDREDQDILNYLADTKKIDDLCQEIGRKIIADDAEIESLCQQPFNNNLHIYITGAVYSSGGHTREIEDWIKGCYSDRRNIVILSEPTKNSHPRQLEKFAAENIEVIHNNSKCSAVERIKWLQKQLAELRAATILISPTLGDICAVAAL